eukprot:1181243-Prymnesium_polylepis.2
MATALTTLRMPGDSDSTSWTASKSRKGGELTILRILRTAARPPSPDCPRGSMISTNAALRLKLVSRATCALYTGSPHSKSENACCTESSRDSLLDVSEAMSRIARAGRPRLFVSSALSMAVVAARSGAVAPHKRGGGTLAAMVFDLRSEGCVADVQRGV